MTRNPQAEPVWLAYVAVPGGSNKLLLSPDEAALYNADPDGYAAEYFKLSKLEYHQWVELDGAPLCGHRTKSGDLCRNITDGSQLDARVWQKRHRKLFCVAHGGEPASGNRRA